MVGYLIAAFNLSNLSTGLLVSRDRPAPARSLALSVSALPALQISSNPTPRKHTPVHVRRCINCAMYNTCA